MIDASNATRRSPKGVFRASAPTPTMHPARMLRKSSHSCKAPAIAHETCQTPDSKTSAAYRALVKPRNKSMKIVVIGGTGLIGSKVVEDQRARDHGVVAALPASGVNTKSLEKAWRTHWRAPKSWSTSPTLRCSKMRRRSSSSRHQGGICLWRRSLPASSIKSRCLSSARIDWRKAATSRQDRSGKTDPRVAVCHTRSSV